MNLQIQRFKLEVKNRDEHPNNEMHVNFPRVKMSREWSKSENCYRKLSLPEMTVYINSQESVNPSNPVILTRVHHCTGT